MLNLFFIFAKPVFALQVPAQMPLNPPSGQTTLWGSIIPGVIQILLFLGFIFAIIYLLWGGISWTMSGGSKESLEKAKKKVTYAILGLILVLLSFFILFTFGRLFGLDLRNP